MIELDTSYASGAKIRVIGVGGGGGNAINSMIKRGLTGVDFVVANTDRQALEHNLAKIKLQIGKETTRGLGAGANPEVGKASVQEVSDEVREVLKGSDMLFVTAGMGGGTGTGGAPIIAQLGQELGALVVGIVTQPFAWEGRKRYTVAENGIAELRQNVDALIVIPNHRLLEIISADTSLEEAFQKVDEVLYNATKGIADIISCHGLVNVDFADVRTVMKGMGDALMGIGSAAGPNRAVEATQNALNSPLLDGISISGAQGVLVNISGSRDMKMQEISEAVSIIEHAAGDDVNLIHGVVYTEEPTDLLTVTVVATGFKKADVSAHDEAPQRQPQKQESFFGNNTNNLDTKSSIVPSPIKLTQSPIGLNSGNFSRVSVSPQQSYGMPDRSPSGSALKNFDEPTFIRNGQSARQDFDRSLGEMEMAGERKIKTIDEAKKRDLDKPAFLRKIMD